MSLLGRARNKVARALLAGLRLLAGGRPVPSRAIRAIRLIGIGEDPLAPRARAIAADAAIKGHLSRHVKGLELGTWALGPRSLGYVQGVVSREKPRLAIEFGSGISTAVLALAMREAGPGMERPLVISIEQSASHAQLTRKLLDAAGLADLVAVVVAPIARRDIEGRQTTCYVLPNDIKRIFGDRKADFVLVDGPAAESGARFGTLPLSHPFVSPRASFVLDDALRDGELSVARHWRSLPYAKVEGVRLIENGLLTGLVLGD